MYLHSTLVAFVLWCGVGFAQLSGELEGAYGPGTYTVIGNISVASQQAAEILPGTTFRFTGPYSFIIYGTLTAEGTESDSIVFTTDTLANPGKWRAIQFISANNLSSLSYCIIENSSAPNIGPDEGGGGLKIQECDIVVSHCTIRFNTCGQSGGGVAIRLANNSHFVDCLITNNHGPYGGGIACNGTPTFERCVIVRNWAGQGGGIGCWSGSPYIVNCTIALNKGDDASALRGSSSHPTVVNTIFAFNHNGPAIGLYDGSSVTMSGYCDFYHHPGGLVAGASIPGLGVITQNNANGDPCDQCHNIFLNPLFADTGQTNVHVMEGSPCVDAGNPASPLDPDGTVSDIGAFYVTESQEFGYSGYVTLIGSTGVNRRFSLTHLEGAITRLIFTGYCEGTVGHVTGPAGDHWNVLVNGDGNNGDSIIFVADPPFTAGTIRGFLLRHVGDCANDVAWCIGDTCGTIAWHQVQPDPRLVALYQNHPNPFNSVTQIEYELPDADHVSLSVYNVLGQQVSKLVDQEMDAGQHVVSFDAGNLPSGVYIYRLKTQDIRTERKLLLIK